MKLWKLVVILGTGKTHPHPQDLEVAGDLIGWMSGRDWSRCLRIQSKDWMKRPSGRPKRWQMQLTNRGGKKNAGNLWFHLRFESRSLGGNLFVD